MHPELSPFSIVAIANDHKSSGLKIHPWPSPSSVDMQTYGGLTWIPPRSAPAALLPGCSGEGLRSHARWGFWQNPFLDGCTIDLSPISSWLSVGLPSTPVNPSAFLIPRPGASAQLCVSSRVSHLLLPGTPPSATSRQIQVLPASKGSPWASPPSPRPDLTVLRSLVSNLNYISKSTLPCSLIYF